MAGAEGLISVHVTEYPKSSPCHASLGGGRQETWSSPGPPGVTCTLVGASDGAVNRIGRS